jgi:KaiC/GvpD/RAD55 family RecA-like ATPase
MKGFLANGKAPTASMQKIFDRFKEWLTDIYNGITGSEIDVRLNKPMRDIYSSMLGKNLVTMNELKKAAIKSFGSNRDEKTFDPKDESTKSFRKELLKYVKALKITEPQAVIDLLKNEFTLEISKEDAKYIIDESTNKKRRAEEESVLKEVNAITSSNNSPLSFMGVINEKTISLFSQSELESLSKFVDKFNQSGNTFGIGAVQAMVEGRVSASETDLRAKKAVTKTEGALTPSTTGFMGMFNNIKDSLRFARESGVATLEFGLTKVGDLTNKYTAHFKKAIESMKVDLTHNTQSEALLIAMIEQELIRNESNLQSTYSDAEIIDMVIKNFKQDIAYLISQNMYKDYTEMMSKHIERFEGMETLAEVLDAASKDSKNLVKILKESNAIDIDARKAMAHQNGVSFKERQDHISIRRKGISKEPREVSIDELANDQDGLSIVQIFESTPLRTHESNYTLERSKDFVSHEYGVYYDPQFVSGQIESFNSVNKAIYTRDGVIKVNSFLRNPKSKDIFRGRLKDSQGMSNENYFKEGLNRSMNQDVIEKQSRQELRDIKLAWGRLPAGKMLTSLTGFWRDKGLMLAMGTLPSL